MNSIQTQIPSNSPGASSAPISDAEAWERERADSYNATPGNLDETDGYKCSACLNKGYIMQLKTDEFGHCYPKVKPCKCMAVRKQIRNMERSGLKNIIKDYTFAKFNAAAEWQAALKAAAEQYAAAPVGWFYVGGQSGAGKTHICTAICREFLLRGLSVRYMLWRDDVVKLKANVNDPDEYRRMMDDFKTCDILYIDDLFKTGKGADGQRQRPTPADINIAFEMLNYRYNNPKLYTVLSSECTINDIMEADEAIGSRIYERAQVYSLKPDRAKNYRLKSAIEL